MSRVRGVQLPRHSAGALGVLLVAGILGTTPASGSEVAPEAGTERVSDVLRRRGRHRCCAAAEARPADRHGGDRLVLLAGPGRPRRRRPAGDRRAVLLDVRVRREGAPAGPGHRQRGPGLPTLGGHRSRGRRRHRHRGRRQRGHGGGVRVPRRRPAREERLAGVHRQRRPVAGGPRARRRRPRRRRQRRGGGDDDQHLAHRRPGLRLRRERRRCSSRRAATPPPGPATTSCPGRATT